MSGAPTIGVLSTSYGGTYHGSVLGGIARAATAAGGRIVAIQTLDAGTVDVDLSEPPDLRTPIAWDHISGFVVVLNAANAAYLSAIRDTGKPVVMISDTVPGFTCPVVLPDNRVGIFEAVNHLVEHGHRDIAFAGYPVQRDFVERHEAYRDALAEHGLEPRAELFFDTGNNQQTGGEQAARSMLAAGMPSTAVIAGNDLNAIGLVRTLIAAGCELPRDQAVVGFDDMESGVYLSPSLASVRQRFDEVGSRAVALVLDELEGREVPPTVYNVSTSFVARESCGCSDRLALGPASADDCPVLASPTDLAAQLAVVLDVDAHDAANAAALDRGVDAIVEAIAAAAEGVTGPTPLQLREPLAGLYQLRSHPESLLAVMRCVRSFGLRVAAGIRDEVAANRVEECIDHVVVALALAQARAQFVDGKHFESTLNMQYAVSMNLLRRNEDPRTLEWIRSTHARGGCLGLWSGDAPGAGAGEQRRADGMLDIVTVFERDREHPVTPRATTSRAFPPADFVALADPEADEMVFVAPMRVGQSDWGMLAIVGPIEARVSTGREMMNQWTALLTIALDHEAVLASLREQEEQLRRAALYDPLTGLANRTLFLDRLVHAIASTRRRPDYHFAVLMLDLDGFKIVNDSLGHLAGDNLLVQVAARLRECSRDTDVPARFGGDEFAILLDDIVDLGSPVLVAERIHAALEAPFRVEADEVVISSSIGIALSTTGYEHAEDVIRDADTAMYSAKWRAKGSHAVFNVAMHAMAVGRLRTEAELRRALDLGELEVHYQPIVQLEDGKLTAFEALLRWQHPTRGLTLPGEFLPIAEESGLTLPIGRWVLGESCRLLRGWQVAGLVPDDVRVSVNVANRQFWHGRLLEDVRDCLDTTGLDPRALVLEITEGVIMHDVDLARQMLSELHDMGVELHIDDFGTGYSSLEALYYLPIDALKIDRSFVSLLDAGPRSGELVRTIVLMGANLGLQLIAEGIETSEQCAQLQEMGCTLGQGFLFSRAVPAGEAEAMVRRTPMLLLQREVSGVT